MNNQHFMSHILITLTAYLYLNLSFKIENASHLAFKVSQYLQVWQETKNPQQHKRIDVCTWGPIEMGSSNSKSFRNYLHYLLLGTELLFGWYSMNQTENNPSANHYYKKVFYKLSKEWEIRLGWFCLHSCGIWVEKK